MTGQGGSGNDPKKKNIPNLNEMILGGLKPRTGKETTKWIANLAEDGDLADIIAAASQAADQTPPPSSVTGWVDKLFDAFQQYDVEFNRAVGMHSELYVGTDRAMITPDLIAKMQSSDHVYYTGRLYTRGWTLLIRGNLRQIEGFILPSDHLISFSGDENRYYRYFQADFSWEQGELQWKCDGAFVPFGRLRAFAKQLFGGLIKVARGEATEREPFVYVQSAEQLKALREGREQADDPLNALTDHHDDHPANVFDDGHRLQTLAAPDDSAGFGAAQSFPHAEPAVRQSPVPETQMPAYSGISPREAPIAQPRFDEMCDLMAAAIERELKLLTDEGARAFQNQDLVAAQKALERSSKVKAMKEQILQTIAEWQKALDE